MGKLSKNTWELNAWYEETVAGKGSYSEDDTFWAWGENEYGGLGLNQGHDVGTVSSPVQVPGTTWNKLPNSCEVGTFMIASKTDGTLWAWGEGGYGGLGQNGATPNYMSSPVQIPGTTWTGHLAASARHWFAIKNDGSMWTCGSNQMGELGVNDKTNRSSPIQIPGTWTDATTGQNRSFGIKSNGTMYGWGFNQQGWCGDGSSTYRSSPSQIPGTSWSKLATSSTSSMAAIRTDGTLWAWGQGGGNLLQNTFTPASSPKQIPGTNWASCSTNYNTIWATKTDGTLWGWGSNDDGQLGQNEQNPSGYSSPVQIPGTNWSSIHAALKGCFVKTTGNSVFSIGSGNNGQRGDNTVIKVSSPVALGGAAWSAISGGRNTCYGIREW